MMRLAKRATIRLLHQAKLIDAGDNPTGRTNKSVRDTWLESTLSSIPAGHRILDAGAGELQYKKFCSHLEYLSQDFGQYDGSGDQIGLQIGSWDNSRLDIVSDITEIPEPDNSFDAIMCIEVFEHIPAPVDALRELDRLLKPGGTLIITAPFCSMTHFSPYFYQTGYSRYFYEHWLAELGYEIEDMQFNGNYFEYLAQELRRLPKMGQQYTPLRLGRIDRYIIQRLIKILGDFSVSDTGSDQLLCYGLHVKARKQSDL